MSNEPHAEMSNEDKIRKIADLGLTILKLREQLNGPKKQGQNNWHLSVLLQKTHAKREALRRSLPQLHIVRGQEC